MCVMFFLMLNFLLAIVVEGYMHVREDIEVRMRDSMERAGSHGTARAGVDWTHCDAIGCGPGVAVGVLWDQSI